MIARLVFIILLSFTACASALSDAPPRAGLDYWLIDRHEGVQPSSPEVIEFFSYGCLHCAEYQPRIAELKSRLPAGIRLRFVPVVFNPQWEAYSRAFFAAEILGVSERSHQPLYDLLHGGDEISMSLNDLATRFYRRFGVDPARFLSVANSVVVTQKLDQAYRLAKAYGVERTPTLAINGMYRVVIDERRGINPARSIDVALYLTER